VERVQKRILKSRWTEAYREITEFESILQDDGIELVKIFMGISKRQQLVRFQNRLDDPYKQWKLTLEDVDARRHWERYVEAAEEMLERTHSRRSPWHLIPANDKAFARTEVLKTIAKRFKKHSSWIESKAQKRESQSLAAALKKLGYEKRTFG
jgi:polyphosphate kinase 2 (PPK2 family)